MQEIVQFLSEAVQESLHISLKSAKNLEKSTLKMGDPKKNADFYFFYARIVQRYFFGFYLVKSQPNM